MSNNTIEARIPPQSMEVEACVLGSMLLRPERIHEAIGTIDPNWFYRPAHRILFNTIAALVTTGKPVDTVLVAHALEASGRITEVGGRDYLADLVTGVPDANNIEYYADILQDKAAKRALISAGAKIVEKGYDTTISGSDAAGDAHAGLQSILAGQERLKPVPADPWEPFPVEALPEPLRPLVVEAAGSLGCDGVFIALPLLAAAASAIGNTRRIQLKSDWQEPPVLWCVIVGESGAKKSPALDVVKCPLQARQHRAYLQHVQDVEAYQADVLQHEVDLSLWKRNGGGGQPPILAPAPTMDRCWVDDTTTEALAVLLNQNPRGLLVARDELSGWLGGFDRYAKSRGGDVARWLEMYGARPLIVDRKGASEPVYVHRAAVCVTGGIQPQTLARALASNEFFENGFAARLLLAYPPRHANCWTTARIGESVEAAVSHLFDNLYGLESALSPDGDECPWAFRLTPEGQEAWREFYDEHAAEQVTLSGDAAALWSKIEGVAARLALVFHCVRSAFDDSTLGKHDLIDEKSIGAGVLLARWFAREAQRVYSLLKEDGAARQQRELLEAIQRKGGTCTPRDLMTWNRKDYATAEKAELALVALVVSGHGRWEVDNHQGGRGRIVRRFVIGP